MKNIIAHCALLILLAQPAMAESETVYKTIAMESASEGEEGMMLVAKVIQNRAKASRMSAEGVVMKRYQFSCWNDRKWAENWLRKYYTAEVHQKAAKAWEEASDSEIKPFIRHYHTVDVRPYWSVGHEPAIRHGRHLFYDSVK